MSKPIIELMYCLDCKDAVKAKYCSDDDCGCDWYKCTVCGGENVYSDEKVDACDGCGKYALKEDLIDVEGLLDRNYRICADCKAKALKEWRLISAAILESDFWKAMVNSALEGEIPFTV